jgi:hypothetical protein
VDSPETVTEAIRLLEGRGYRSDFRVAEAAVHCAACNATHPPAELVVRETFRFEGDTDPADEAIVLAVECPSCGAKGIIVSAFGPDADPELLALVAGLEPDR